MISIKYASQLSEAGVKWPFQRGCPLVRVPLKRGSTVLEIILVSE